jgi:hypothetical protein
LPSSLAQEYFLNCTLGDRFNLAFHKYRASR